MTCPKKIQKTASWRPFLHYNDRTRYSLGVFSIVLFWRGYSPLEAVGYENAGYGNNAHRKGDFESGFSREDCSRNCMNKVELAIIVRHTSI